MNSRAAGTGGNRRSFCGGAALALASAPLGFLKPAVVAAAPRRPPRLATPDIVNADILAFICGEEARVEAAPADAVSAPLPA